VAEYSRGADTCTELPPLPYLIDAAERALIEGVVMAEAGNQPPEGMMAVAQCIIDAARKDGIRPDEVISRYQYAAQHPAPSDAVREAVSRVFDEGERVTAEKTYYFYNPDYGISAFHESRKLIVVVQDHKFYQ
jgi:spore germination cell wall hydrolase CwlJ-like protein